MRPSRINTERGGALIATLVISMLLLGVLVWYLGQASLTTRLQTHEHAAEFALTYAETGLQFAEQQLQFPLVLATTGTVTGGMDMPHGRFTFEMTRRPSASDDSAENPFQPIVVEALSTGYYDFEKGSARDPITGKAAQAARLETKICFWTSSLFTVASPSRLRVNQSMSSVFGPLYARDLVFTMDTRPPRQPSVIQAAFYGDFVGGADGLLDPSPPFVTFASTSGPQPIGVIPHFPVLSGRFRQYYANLASESENRLKNGDTLEGRVDPPSGNGAPVYFCEGDLHLGKMTPFEPTAPMVVYVKGNLIVHRSMQGAGNSWAAFLVEKDLCIAPRSRVRPLYLRGNFYVNRAATWKGSSPDPSTFFLELTGSLVAGQGFDDMVANLPKRFTRWQIEEAALPLPRFTQRLETRILSGKFRH